MASLVWALLPLAAVSALLPIWLLIAVSLLGRPGGTGLAAAFVGGMTVTRLAQGVVFALLATGAEETVGEQQAHWLVSGALVLLGLVLLVAAARIVRGIRRSRAERDRAAADVADRERPPPRWARMIDSATVPRSFVLGAGLVAVNSKAWILTLGALGVIAESDQSRGAQTGVYLAFIMASQAVLIGLVLLALLVPARAQRWMGTLSHALQRNSRAISLAVAVLFGVVFLVRGIAGLIG